MKDIHHTASDDEGDQVTYGNPEHYIGGLFDLRSQEQQEWSNSDLASSSSYKPLAAYRKLQEKTRIVETRMEAEIDYSWSASGWNESQLDSIFPSDSKTIQQTPVRETPKISSSSATSSSANRLWKVSPKQQPTPGSENKALVDYRAAKSPNDYTLDRPSHWASANKGIKRPAALSTQKKTSTTGLPKKAKPTEHLVPAKLPPPAPIAIISTGSSSAGSAASAMSIKPAWMQRLNNQSATSIATQGMIDGNTGSTSQPFNLQRQSLQDEIVVDQEESYPTSTHYTQLRQSSVSAVPSSGMIPTDRSMDKMQVHISPNGKGKSTTRTHNAKAGSYKWRLMKIHRDAESSENWMNTIRLQTHADLSGFDNPKNRAKSTLQCLVLELCGGSSEDAVPGSPFRMVKVMIESGGSAHTHGNNSVSMKLLDEMNPNAIDNDVYDVNTNPEEGQNNPYVSLLVLRENMYPDLLQDLSPGKTLKLFDAQEVAVSSENGAILHSTFGSQGLASIEMSQLKSILLCSQVWEYGS